MLCLGSWHVWLWLHSSEDRSLRDMSISGSAELTVGDFMERFFRQRCHALAEFMKVMQICTRTRTRASVDYALFLCWCQVSTSVHSPAERALLLQGFEYLSQLAVMVPHTRLELLNALLQMRTVLTCEFDCLALQLLLEAVLYRVEGALRELKLTFTMTLL